MSDCPNAFKSGLGVRCNLLPAELTISASVCGRCKSEWDGAPPTNNALTPTLVAMVATVPRDGRSRGLGDRLHKAAAVLGVPTCFGCGQRVAKLNERFPAENR